MNTAYLILGSNLDDKLQNLMDAQKYIEERAGKIIKRSAVYVTSAWGNENQPDFLNQALCVETFFSASDLLDTLLSIEQLLGRVRDEKKWMERTMDIDILFYNNDIIDTESLKVPHPFIQERKFVLVPMDEIAPSLVHPLLRRSITQLLSNCSDNLEITTFQTNDRQTNII